MGHALDDHWRGIAIQLIQEHMDSQTIARKLECAVAEITALRVEIRQQQADGARAELFRLYQQGNGIDECVASMRARGVPAAPGKELARLWLHAAGLIRRRPEYSATDRCLYIKLRKTYPKETHEQLAARWRASTGRHLERITGQAWVSKASVAA